MNDHPRRAAGAIYYPYIHIANADWLRANLIIFPHVERMVPYLYDPSDPPDVAQFADGRDGQPLFRPADVFAKRPQEAQRALAAKLKRDSTNSGFVRRFGKAAAQALPDATATGFQIHTGKLLPELRDALREKKLSWTPNVPDGVNYVQLHPSVGEAVMSTIAIACSQASGLHVVGDERSGQLHSCLLTRDLESVYDAWLGNHTRLAAPVPPSGEQLFEYILGVRADVSTLSPKRLRELTEDREPINKLLDALRLQASTISAMDPGAHRDEAFRDAVEKLFKSWQADRKNMGSFFRRFFNKDAGKVATDFTGKVAEKALTGVVGGVGGGLAHAAAAAPMGTQWGTLATGGVIAAGAGLVVGLVAHGIGSYRFVAERQRNSPYGFLTSLEREGVLFRAGALQSART